MDERQTDDRKIVIWALEEDMPMVNAAAEAYAAAKGEEDAQTPIEPRGFETYEELESESIRAYDEGAEADLMLVPDRIAYNSAINGRARTFDREELDINRKYMPHRLSALTVDGQICGIPATSRPVALYYNKSLTVQAGLEISADETTIDELYETAKIMKENLDIPMFAMTDDLTRILYYSAECALNDIGDSTVEEKTKEVMELLKNFSEAGYLYAEPNMTWDTIIEKLIAGEIVGVIGGPEWKGIIDRAYENCETTDEWGIARLPKNETFGKDVGLEGMCWVMPLKADGIAATYEFVTEYADCYEALQSMADNTRHIPAANDASGVSAPTGGAFGDTDAFAILCEIGADAAELETYDVYATQVDELINNALDSVISNGEGVETTTNTFYTSWALFPDRPKSPIVKEEWTFYIKSRPKKKVFYLGDIWDYTGLEAYVSNTQGKGYVIPNHILDIEIPDLTVVGVKTVWVIYKKEDKEIARTSFDIEVRERELTGLEVKQAPDRTAYVADQTFDASGMRVVGIYTGGEEREIDISSLTITPQVLSVGDTRVTLSYTDKVTKTTTVSVTVYEQYEKLIVENNPYKTIYIEGEMFDQSGLSVCLQYPNGKREKVRDFYFKGVNGNHIQTLRKFMDRNNNVIDVYGEIADKKVELCAQIIVDVLPRGSKIGKYDRPTLEYSCGAGVAAVDVTDGSATFACRDVSLGTGRRTLDISRCYSADGWGIDADCLVGKNMKLNVQQFLFPFNGGYRYIDGAGDTHIFKPLREN